MLAAHEPAMSKTSKITKKTYTAAPKAPEELRTRYETMLAVMSGAITVSDGARRLGMSRNHFQTLMHRGLAAMMDGISPRMPGRAPKSEQETALQSEVEKLRRENLRLKEQAQTIDRIMSVVGGMIREGAERSPRARRETKTPRDANPASDDDESDPRCELFALLRRAGVRAEEAAKVMGLSASTTRRWAARRRSGQAPSVPRTRSLPIVEQQANEVRQCVRATQGLIGADALRHAVAGVSRRQAAALKRDELTVMERERVAACMRITVTSPGVLRGFDAMHVANDQGVAWLLVACDGAVPYRTAISVTERYDGAAVARLLSSDFEKNGPPLVLRLDRARMHATHEVRDVCARFGVLMLHGPPYYPRYYGQLERQNRDHRAWLATLRIPDNDSLTRAVDEMKDALNTLWPRRTLGWKTPLQAWNERAELAVHRAEFRKEVHERATRWVAESHNPRMTIDLAERLAIEQALFQRNYLRRHIGTGC